MGLLNLAVSGIEFYGQVQKEKGTEIVGPFSKTQTTKQVNHWHAVTFVSFKVFRSVMVHLIVPGGACNDAVPE